MRASTRQKLFNEGERLLIQLTETLPEAKGIITFGVVMKTNKQFVIYDYPKETDGFEVYIPGSGNSVNSARKNLGLEPKPETS